MAEFLEVMKAKKECVNLSEIPMGGVQFIVK